MQRMTSVHLIVWSNQCSKLTWSLLPRAVKHHIIFHPLLILNYMVQHRRDCILSFSFPVLISRFNVSVPPECLIPLPPNAKIQTKRLKVHLLPSFGLLDACSHFTITPRSHFHCCLIIILSYLFYWDILLVVSQSFPFSFHEAIFVFNLNRGIYANFDSQKNRQRYEINNNTKTWNGM